MSEELKPCPCCGRTRVQGHEWELQGQYVVIPYAWTPIGDIELGTLRKAARENDALRARIAELEAEVARLEIVLEDTKWEAMGDDL